MDTNQNAANDNQQSDELQGLCMKCRDENNKPTMQTMKDVSVEEKNGRFSARGTCAKCDGNMFKFLSKEDAAKHKKAA